MCHSLRPPALYYPYIHIRSEHWLKATLLCVPVVKRIVPEEYTPEDNHEITRYTRIVGRDGPLLQTVPSFSHAAITAQERLLAKLCENSTAIRRKYDRTKAPAEDEYWIHEAKFDYKLLRFLRRQKLAWYSRHSRAFGHRNWCALHPILGSAIMTTLGLSIAREQHYDIVTPSSHFHEALLANNEDEVFDKLLEGYDPERNPTTAQAGNDLGQLVITMTGINYQALRPEDIPELQASRHFSRFQKLIGESALLVDRESDAHTYRTQLTSKAEDIIDAWHETKTGLSTDIQDVLYGTASGLVAKGPLGQMHAAGIIDLAISGGITVGVKAWRRYRSVHAGDPYRYLTQLDRSQDEALRVTYPLGLDR